MVSEHSYGATAQIRATGIAAYFLGIGSAGAPFDPIGALFAAVAILVLVMILERRATTLKTFIVGFFGTLLCSIFQHATLGELLGRQVRTAAPAVATQLYFGVFMLVTIVALGLGLLAASSMGRRRAPVAIATIGTLLGVVLFFLGPF
jgi:hypothetical protein